MLHYSIAFYFLNVQIDQFCAWDLNFGRDTTNKRIFLLDPLKPLGKDLKERYDKIWNQGETIFQYHDKKISQNNSLRCNPDNTNVWMPDKHFRLLN